MFGIIYLVALGISYIVSYFKCVNKTYKDLIENFDYSRYLFQLAFLHVLLACTGVYSSINIFATIFAIGLLYNLFLMAFVFLFNMLLTHVLNYDLNSIDTTTENGQKVYEAYQALQKSSKEYFVVPYSLERYMSSSVFIYILNILLIIGFYMNVKGGH